MMEVEKPWEFKEDVEIMEEDTGGGLQTRERKKMLDHGHGHGNGNGGEEEFNTGEEEAQVLEEHNSVFFDPTKVFDHVTEVSGKNGVTEVMQFSAQKEEANETSSPKGKELGTQENVNAQEINHNSNNSKFENGSRTNVSHEVSDCSETMTIANGKAGLKLIATIDDIKNSVVNLNGSLDISNGSMSRTNVHEIEVEKDEHVTQGKVNIEEYDLEKILDEQETHDLYCPNCNSCITRRVILRKRKRTVRQIIRDEPPKKPQLAEPSANASNQSVPERHEQGPHDIFRCLSCFAFFIPTGCGFNIFRIFGRTEVNQEVQVQHPSASRDMSDNCGSWLLSCFQSGDSPKKADVDSAKKPLLSDTQSSNHATTSAEASTLPAHSHGTTGKPEQSKKPLLDESSSQLQTTTTKNEEEFKPSRGEFHGTAVSSEASHTSFASSKINSGKSETGFVQTEITHVVTGQQDVVIPPPKPVGEAVTDTTHLDGKEDVQESTVATSENGSFFSQAIPTSEIKVESPSETKIVPEGIIPMGDKPTSLIPQAQAVGPAASPHLVLPIPDAVTTVTPRDPRSEQRDEWDILKAIVYGGLVESITSLSVVSAAAAASGAKTLDIFILGIANLIGGLPLIFHNITDLRNLGDVDENDEQVGHYWLQLGRRSRFRLHMVMAVLSYILFGLLPPVIYGLSFRKSDNRENKMVATAAASLACIALLAIGKAHVKRPRTYIKTLVYYLTIGVSASGLSYVAGALITRLLAHFGLIDQGASAPASPSLLFPDAVDAGTAAWASY